MLTALPLPSTAPSREVSPEPMLPSLGTESLGKHTMTPSIVGHFVGAPSVVFPPRDFRRICEVQPLVVCDREGGRGLQQPALGFWHTEFLPTEAK